MRRRWRVGFLAALLAFAEIYSLLPSSLRPAAQAPAPRRLGAFHVPGWLGDTPIRRSEIARAASASGLEFVIVTHPPNRPLPWSEGPEGDVDVLVEIEEKGPAGDLVRLRTASNGSTEAHTDHSSGGQGLTVIAHPSHPTRPWAQLERHADGIEIGNLGARWADLVTNEWWDSAVILGCLPVNAFLASLRFVRWHPKDLAAWDGMNSVSGGHFGILGHDEPPPLGIPERITGRRWPGYPETFRLAANAILADEAWAEDFSRRREQLYHLIRRGRLAVVVTTLFPFQGNDWRMECPKSIHVPGDLVTDSRDCRFVVDTPHGLPFARHLRLLRNGELEAERSTHSARAEIPFPGKPGAYRLEVLAAAHTASGMLLRHPVPYVFYNPIYVR